jgi:hypothetical protein
MCLAPVTRRSAIDNFCNMFKSWQEFRQALREIKDVDFRICTDVGLRRRALVAVPQIPQYYNC